MKIELVEIKRIMDNNDGDLVLTGLQKWTELPDGLHIKRDLILSGSNVEELPKDILIERNLILQDSMIETIPSGTKIGGSLNLCDTNVKHVHQSMIIQGDLYVPHNVSLDGPNVIGGDLHCYSNHITGVDMVIGNHIFCYDENSELSDKIKLGGRFIVVSEPGDDNALLNGDYDNNNYLYANDVLTHILKKVELTPNSNQYFVGVFPKKNVLKSDKSGYVQVPSLMAATNHMDVVEDAGKTSEDVTTDAIMREIYQIIEATYTNYVNLPRNNDESEALVVNDLTDMLSSIPGLVHVDTLIPLIYNGMIKNDQLGMDWDTVIASTTYMTKVMLTQLNEE